MEGSGARFLVQTGFLTCPQKTQGVRQCHLLHTSGLGMSCDTFYRRWEYEAYVSTGTLIDSQTILCLVPPLGNNTSPVFLEVCLSGHPDRSVALGRAARDDFCTTSLNRFEYIDLAQTNLTLWNSSVIAGPIAGGTAVAVGGSDDFRGGLPDYGNPMCIFDGIAVPARLDGARPLTFAALSGENTSVPANIGRQRMCRGANPDELRSFCSCDPTLVVDVICGCGCRRLLLESPLLDMCVDTRIAGVAITRCFVESPAMLHARLAPSPSAPMFGSLLVLSLSYARYPALTKLSGSATWISSKDRCAGFLEQVWPVALVLVCAQL